MHFSLSLSGTASALGTLGATAQRHTTQKISKQFPSAEEQNFNIFRHIAKGRDANNTFAKSLKSSFINIPNTPAPTRHPKQPVALNKKNNYF